MSGAQDAILQSGAIGAILLIVLAAFGWVGKRLLDSKDAEVARVRADLDRERAERAALGEQMKEQNLLIQKDVIPLALSLAQAVQVLPPLLDRVVRELERRRD